MLKREGTNMPDRRNEDEENVDVSVLRIVDTTNVLTTDDVKTLKELATRYKNAKWAVTILLGLGTVVTPLMYYINDHVNFGWKQ